MIMSQVVYLCQNGAMPMNINPLKCFLAVDVRTLENILKVVLQTFLNKII